MSADNVIRIIKGKDKFIVEEQFYEGGIITKIGEFKTLEEALEAAEDYRRNAEFGVEYGIEYLK